jgi:putative thioredoxin
MVSDATSMNLQGAIDLSGLVKKNTQAASPASPHPPSGGSGIVRDITEAQMAGIVELSQSVPVILEFYGQGHAPALGPIVESFGGRLVLATIDVATSPELVQGLGITGIPTVFAIIQGRPAPLFQGLPPDDDIKKLFVEVLQVASQAGVTGQVTPEPAETPEVADDTEPEWLTRASEALAGNDFDAATAAYQAGLASDPKNPEALAGVARVGLLRRVHESGHTHDAIRQEAAASPGNIDAQLLVADLDVAGGHVDDAFRRLLTLFRQATEDDKTRVREHLVGLFDAVGQAHPSVVSARQQLASLLF